MTKPNFHAKITVLSNNDPRGEQIVASETVTPVFFIWILNQGDVCKGNFAYTVHKMKFASLGSRSQNEMIRKQEALTNCLSIPVKKGVCYRPEKIKILRIPCL